MQKADQIMVEVGANEVASTDKLAVELFGLVVTFAVVPVRHALPQGRLIVHFPDGLDQIVIELLDPHRHTTSLGPPHILAGFLGETLPPLFEANEVDSGNALPFDWVGIFRARCRELLSESKDISL